MAEFVARTKIKSFVAMHRVDYPIWSPTKPGEYRLFDGGKFYGEI